MKIESLHVGMQVKHPQYGLGTVKTIAEHSADIVFNEGLRTVDPVISELQPAEPSVNVSGLDKPLAEFIEDTARAVVQALGVDLEKEDPVVQELGARWHGGKLVLHPADPTLQTKELPLETFFHKIVMMRNNFRVLEQKINAHDKLTDAEKIEMQQHITRCYGSMTSFNLLFRSKENQFNT